MEEGGDNPYYIEQMFNFISDPKNNVAWASYFDTFALDGDHQLCPRNITGKPVTLVQSAAKFRELFAPLYASTSTASDSSVADRSTPDDDNNSSCANSLTLTISLVISLPCSVALLFFNKC